MSDVVVTAEVLDRNLLSLVFTGIIPAYLLSILQRLTRPRRFWSAGAADEGFVGLLDVTGSRRAPTVDIAAH